MNQVQRLPIGMSSFQSIRHAGFLYIDKTQLIKQLIEGARYNFLARPRRFGKSLLLSTMEELFLGNKELFKGLWIEEKSDYAWPVHPVIYIDFNCIKKGSSAELKRSLNEHLDDISIKYGVDISFKHSPDEKLVKLTELLSARGQVVILIDEYDQPMVHNLDKMDVAAANREVLKEFYSAIKSLDRYIRFFFVTGVSKFTKTSLFFGMNNLRDISFYPSVAQLLGYTKEEIETYLMPSIDDMAQKRSMTREAVFAEMKQWYNGYRFSSDETYVYNPWSIFNYLDLQKNENFWFSTGSPSFLIKLLKQNNYSFADLENLSASQSSLDTFDLDNIRLVALLYQTGYLTITRYDEDTKLYHLAYPNKEVEFSLASHLLGAFLNTQADEVSHIAGRMKQALVSIDMAAFTLQLQTLLAGISHKLHIEKEAYYHSILYTISILLGADTTCEVHTSVGIIDMVLTLPHTIFVFEFKFDKTAEEALKQIEAKRYIEKYQTSGKQVVAVGMNFAFKNKKVSVSYSSGSGAKNV